jgi:methylation protein EvaC
MTASTKNCRICGIPLRPFMDFGKMPMGNAFLTSDHFDSEYFYHMKVAVCDSCFTLQVIDIPDPDQMFHENYAYFASTSQYMSEHFRAMSEKLIAQYVSDQSPFVVEIGCNDGITLQNFANAGIPHLGVEPSANVAQAARDKGINVESAFFNVETARRITEEHGHADLFIATNTMHHIEDINSVAAGVEILLKPKGVMVQEDPYLGDMLELGSYDQLYAEHMYIWSLASLGSAFGRHGLEIFDIERNHFHGGCMRYYLCRKGAHEPTERFLAQQAKEAELGLKHQETYEAFSKRCESSRDRLVERLETYRKQGKRVVGYGATAKSATIINFCGLTTDHIEYISDTTPTKQGKYSPGAHIPIVAPETFAESYPDYAVLFAWNHFDEINAKEKSFVKGGGKWVFPIGMIDEK